jgi:hypothetical protein
MQNLSPRAVWLYLVRLGFRSTVGVCFANIDDFWASLCRASLPPASGLLPARVPTVESLLRRYK